MDPPPYSVCIKKKNHSNIENLKIQLERIENELLSMKSNDPRKPSLRRKAADLEEEIQFLENSKPKNNFLELLNSNIELLSDFMNLENNYKPFQQYENIWQILDDLTQNLPKHFCPFDTPMSDSKKEELILYFKTQWQALYNNSEIINQVIPRVCDTLLKSNDFNVNNFKFKLATELSFIELELRDKKKAKEEELKLTESKLNFQKSLLYFIENLLEEKKYLEKRIHELEYIITNN